MSTPYETIYKRFAQKITDFELAGFKQEDLSESLLGLMESALAKVRPLQSNLDNRDDIEQVFNDNLLNVEIEIISLYMVAEWVTPKLYSVMYTTQFYGGKDEKFYSQSNQIEELRKILKDAISMAKKLRRDYKYQNFSYTE